MKGIFFVLAAAYLSFVALGFFDGAFAVAWPIIRYDMGLHLDQAGVVIIVNSILYTLSSSQIGRLSQRMRCERVNLLGILATMLGLLSLSLAPGFATLVIAGGLAGIGMGMIDASLNLYMARNFSARYMNWLHCSWSIGATLSPIVMSQMVLIAGWRSGYVALAAIQGMIVIFVLTSLARGVWIARDGSRAHGLETMNGKTYLTHPRYQYINISIFFLYMGADYSIGFWTASVMMESRNLGIDYAAVFPAVYFASIMVGRIISGYLAKRFSNMAMIRAGFSLTIVGLVIMILSNNVTGIALVGLGFAPVYPSLMHDTARLFNPSILTKQVGRQVAAAGVGIAIMGPAIGLALSRFSPEVLFPFVAVIVAIVFILNEITERGLNTVK